MMNIEVRIAVMSHLSDAQDIGDIAIQSETSERILMKKEQDLHINFAKYLLIMYGDNLNQEISEDKLNQIWKNICDESGDKKLSL